MKGRVANDLLSVLHYSYIDPPSGDASYVVLSRRNDDFRRHEESGPVGSAASQVDRMIVELAAAISSGPGEMVLEDDNSDSDAVLRGRSRPQFLRLTR